MVACSISQFEQPRGVNRWTLQRTQAGRRSPETSAPIGRFTATSATRRQHGATRILVYRPHLRGYGLSAECEKDGLRDSSSQAPVRVNTDTKQPVCGLPQSSPIEHSVLML